MVKKVKLVNNRGGKCTSIIAEGVISPVALIEASFVFSPYSYNQYSKPRYNITLAFDREIEGENAFIKWVDKISTQSKVPPKIWIGRQKRYLVKFQTADKIEVYEYISQEEKPKLITIMKELERESYAQVEFSIMKYYDRMRGLDAFSFQPKAIYIYKDNQKDFFNVDYKGRGD